VPWAASISEPATWTRAWSAEAGTAAPPSKSALPAPATGGVRWRLGIAPDRRGAVVTVGTTTVTIPAALDDGAWHHLALVGAAGGTTLLVDGVEAGSLAEPFGAAAATELVLGDGFLGELDELRTWSTTRTAAELATAARRPLTGREPGLTGLWRFDEGSGLEVFDAGPSGLDMAVATTGLTTQPSAFAPSQAWRHRQVASGEDMAPAAAGYDADGDPLTLTVTGAPANGSATADQASLEVGYSSAIGWGGTDQLTFTLSDGPASSDYTLAIVVAPPTACTASSQCGGGVCLQGLCVPERQLDVRAGGCGCGSGGGGALALWSVLSLALVRRRRPVAARRLP